MSPAAIHEESVGDYRGRLARLLGKRWHRHYVVRRTWTLDNTPWAADPNALEFCECGAWRPLWGAGRSWFRARP